MIVQFQLQRDDFKLDIDLTLPDAGISALFGASGCGKTTLLRVLAGLERPASGHIQLGDCVWQQAGYFLPTHRRPLGYVFQEARLFPHLTVYRNLCYGFERIAKKQRKISLAQVIALLDIEPLLTRKPVQLSGGERQRVAIARALAVSPSVLLMDEPLAALDATRKQEILPYIQTLAKELAIPVIYVSHCADEVAQIADYLALMAAGKIQAVGKINDLLTCLALPLAQSQEAESLIEATVAAHDTDYHLTYLDFAGGRFSVAHKNLAIGQPVRLRLLARDVSLTLTQQPHTSILNIFPAQVEAIQVLDNAQVVVRLLLNSVLILARITRKSMVLLDLVPKKRVYAQVKTVALLF